MDAIALEKKYCAHNYEPLPVVLTRGRGAHLWDMAGRRYVDMMSAYSAASHGHSHPRILAVLAAHSTDLKLLHESSSDGFARQRDTLSFVPPQDRYVPHKKIFEKQPHAK